MTKMDHHRIAGDRCAMGTVGGAVVGVALWAAAGTAQAADIFVPLDVPTIEAAVAIAEDGDSIFVVEENLFDDVVFTDLGGKAISLYSGVRKSPDEIATREGSLWILPDGSRLAGSSLQFNGTTRVRDGARVIFDTHADDGSVDVSYNGGDSLPILEVGENARLDVVTETMHVYSGGVSLRPGSALTQVGGGIEVVLSGVVSLEDDSRLATEYLHLGYQSSFLADHADIECNNFSMQNNSYFDMKGGQLLVRQIAEFYELSRVSVEGSDLFFGDQFDDTVIRGEFSMRGGSLTSPVGIEIDVTPLDLGGPGSPLLQDVEITTPLLGFASTGLGEVLFSGEVLGTAYNLHFLTILGDTTFYGFFENQDTITVLDGELSFLGGLDNFGSIVVVGGEGRGAAPRTVRVLSDLIVRPDRSLVLGAGDRLMIRGDLEIQTTLGRGAIGLAGATVEILPGPGNPSGFDGEYVEAVGADLGPSERGFDAGRPDAASFGELIVRNGVEALVADWVPNTEGPGALYADTVRVDAGGTLRVAENTRVYCRTLIADGVVETPERVVLVGGCGADLASPFGVVDLGDIVAFVEAFGRQEPAGDFGEPYGMFDLADISGFVGAFGAGCD